MANICLCSIKKKLPPKNGVATKFMAKFCMCSTEKNFLPKMELPQNLWQLFASVASEKKTSLPKMELPQNLWQTFASVASEKELPPKNGVATKFMANVRFF